MTTLILIVVLMVVGSPMCAFRSVRVLGVLCVATALFLWFGLSALCGYGPLIECAVVQ